MILTPKQVNEIIDWRLEFDMRNVLDCPLTVGKKGIYQNKLKYDIALVERRSDTQWFFDLIQEYIKDDYPDNRASEGECFYLHKWGVGDKFTKHVDKQRNDSWGLVVGASLNSDYEGGNLIAYNPNEELATNVGELYTMSIKRLHEVTEVTSGLRYSFVYFIPQTLLFPPGSLL